MTGPGAAPMLVAIHSPSDDCTCHSDPTDRDPDRCGYRLLADRVIALLNPPDDDVAEVSLCLTAVEGIAGYVRSLPCTCLPGAAEHEVDPCGRCSALGMAEDRAEER